MTSVFGSIVAPKDPASSRISAAYMRVSSDDQNLDLQISVLKAQKPGKTYSDIESGTISQRLAYTELCNAIEKDAVSEVIVYRLDRLGRDPLELIRFFDLMEIHQVKFRSLTEPWLSDWNQGPMQFLIWWNQIGMTRLEILLLKDRQKRGIAAARSRGVHLGRPRKNVR